MLTTGKFRHFILKSVGRPNTNLYYSSHNPNRRKYQFLLLRKCIKCDNVIKQTSKKMGTKSLPRLAELYWVIGLVGARSVNQIQGEPPII